MSSSNRSALERLKTAKPQAPPPMVVPRPKKAEPAPAPDETAAAGGDSADSGADQRRVMCDAIRCSDPVPRDLLGLSRSELIEEGD